MPLMKPELQAQLRNQDVNKVLEQAGLRKPTTEGTIQDKLDAAGLSVDETLEELQYIAKHSGNEALKLRALETVLKAHGALKETQQAPPTFNINIINKTDENDPSVNGVNPIFLPRQLHAQLNQPGNVTSKEN